jgi:hypothetical protein
MPSARAHLDAPLAFQYYPERRIANSMLYVAASRTHTSNTTPTQLTCYTRPHASSRGTARAKPAASAEPPTPSPVRAARRPQPPPPGPTRRRRLTCTVRACRTPRRRRMPLGTAGRRWYVPVGPGAVICKHVLACWCVVCVCVVGVSRATYRVLLRRGVRVCMCVRACVCRAVVGGWVCMEGCTRGRECTHDARTAAVVRSRCAAQQRQTKTSVGASNRGCVYCESVG